MTTNTTTTNSEESMALIRKVFSICRGRAQIRISGQMPGFDEKRREIFMKSYDEKTIWMSADRLLDFISEDEAARLRNLQAWDGSNEYQITMIVLQVVRSAISAYQK